MPDHTPDSWELCTGRDISTITAQEARDELHMRCPMYRVLMARETVERNAAELDVEALNEALLKRMDLEHKQARLKAPLPPLTFADHRCNGTCDGCIGGCWRRMCPATGDL